MSIATHHMRADLELPGNPVVEIRVSLAWDTADPHAVTITMHVTRSTPWLFAIDLLHAGLRGPAGIGDIHIRPAECGRVEIILSSPDGRAALQVSAFDVRTFLAGTWCVEQPPIPDFVDDIDFGEVAS